MIVSELGLRCLTIHGGGGACADNRRNRKCDTIGGHSLVCDYVGMQLLLTRCVPQLDSPNSPPITNNCPELVV